MRWRIVLAGVLAAGLALVSAGWAQTEATVRGGGGSAGVVDPDEQERRFAAAAPEYEELADGLWFRRVLETEAPSGLYSVEVWGLLVGAGRSTERAALPGAAVLLIRSGRAVLVTENGKQELELGSTAFVPEGVAAGFVNPDQERPAILRAVILSGRR